MQTGRQYADRQAACRNARSMLAGRQLADRLADSQAARKKKAC
jgi:hypothetical protein